MCTLTKECFIYQAQIKHNNKELSHSQKLNQYATDFGYKNYNAILPIISTNKPSFDIRLLFPDMEPCKDLEEMKELSFNQFPDRYFSVNIDNDIFDEVEEMIFSETDNYMFGEKFFTEEYTFTAKSIKFAPPSNIFATFSEQSFGYFGRYDDMKYKEAEKVIESDFDTLIMNGDNCFTVGATAATTDALHFQYNKTIKSIKDIQEAENISFYALNNIVFVDTGDAEYLKNSFQILMYTFIHRYMRYDYYSSKSFIIEFPFSKENMIPEQYHLVQFITETITGTCELWNKMFTKPVHLNYSEFDEDMTYSYLFFTRKDIEGKISHTLRDTMMCYEM